MMSERWVIVLLALHCSAVQALCVKVWKANLRSAPSGNAPVTWTVGKFTPLIKLERKGGWYKVEDQDGAEHWIFGSSVTTQFQCLSVKGKATNLRTGPGAQYPLAAYGLADKYSPFKRRDRRGNWYQVEDDHGYIFWLHDSMVWRPITVSRIGF